MAREISSNIPTIREKTVAVIAVIAVVEIREEEEKAAAEAVCDLDLCTKPVSRFDHNLILSCFKMGGGELLELNNNNDTARTNCQGSYECAVEAAEFIRPYIKCGTPQIGIICGSGLGELGERVENSVTLDYDSIPYFKKRGF